MYKFSLFADSVDHLVTSNSASLQAEITNNESYVSRYNLLTTLIKQAAVSIFKWNKPYQYVERPVTSPHIRELVALITHLGGAISWSRGNTRQMSHGSHLVYD